MELLPRNGCFSTKTPSIEELCCRQVTHLPGGRGEAVREVGDEIENVILFETKDNCNLTSSCKTFFFISQELL